MQPVLILGAGINGSAIARELLLNGVPVVLVDTADLAFGATAYSSRLIHGGLRYLEYGEFDLVRESLAERTRLLRLAPHLVRPLKLFIPARTRFSGVVSSAARFLHWRWWPATANGSEERGLALIRAGLAFYDAYARDPTLPKHEAIKVGAPQAVKVDPNRYRYLAAYFDAQVTFPERLVVAMLHDAEQLAAEAGVRFQFFNYHQTSLSDSTARIADAAGKEVATFIPSLIINATGAWVDHTLARLQIPSPTLMGGTKGSHFFTFHEGLKKTLAGHGLYAAAADGRPVFVTPLASAVLVGTTDQPFSGDPGAAVATEPELAYLLDAVNTLLPQVRLQRGDIEFHYSGVRPLPHADKTKPSAITRRHWLEWNTKSSVPLVSVIGGKLTTCRSLAEQTVAAVLEKLGHSARANSRERVIPGGEGFAPHKADHLAHPQSVASELKMPVESVAAVVELCGSEGPKILREVVDNSTLLCDTTLPESFVRWVIRHEWARTLDDLVERRLMLLYHQQLSLRCLRRLAELMIEAGALPADEMESAVQQTAARLADHFGKRLSESITAKHF